ncbi:MAG: hypothetical protein QM597_10600 [Aeromicrobium sp.]|uniref:hypothetical protein n=1 Tax=Aeromicrobium sp. TaxID=1871063 RepID=UPI0039E435A5
MSPHVPGPVPPPSQTAYPPAQPGYPQAAGYGGYSGGGYGSAPTPPGGGGKKTGLIIGIVVAILLLVAGLVTAVILIATGGDNSEDRSDDDTHDDTKTEQTGEEYLAVVEDYLAAYDDGDCEALVDLYPDQFDDADACEDEYPYSDPDDVEIDIQNIEATDFDDEDDPSEVTVSVEFTENDLDADDEEDHTVDFTVEKDNGDWIITDY